MEELQELTYTGKL